MRMAMLAFGLLASVLSPAAGAEGDALAESFVLEDGAALVTACTVPETHPLHATAKGFCLGYMTGAMQLYAAAVQSPKIDDAVCPGAAVSRVRMRDIFLEWARTHPERLGEPAIDTLFRAAVAAFPCA